MIGRRSGVYYRFLFSYLVMLLIPILVIGSLVYRQVARVFTEDAVAANTAVLEQIQKNIDQHLIDMKRVASQISLNPALTPFAIRNSPVDAMRAINELRTYGVVNHLVYELLLLIRGDDLLYAASGAYSFPTFFQALYADGAVAKARLHQVILLADEPRLIVSGLPASDGASGGSQITYVVPVPPDVSFPYATAVFLISEDSIRRIIVSEIGMPRADVAVLTGEGNAFIAVTHVRGTSGLSLDEMLAARDGRDEWTVSGDGTTLVGRALESARTGLTYVSLTDARAVLARVDQLRNRSAISLTLIVIAGGAAVLWAMQMNFSPIARLKEYVETRLGGPEGRGSEIESVRNAVAVFADANRTAVRDHLLYLLLNGAIDTREALTSAGEGFGLSFSQPALFCFIVRLPTQLAESEGMKERIVRLVESAGIADLEAHVKELIDRGRLLVVASAHTPDPAVVASIVRSIHARLTDQIGPRISIGVGSAPEELRQVGRSFLEASTALDYGFVRGHGSVIFFHEIPPGDDAALPQADHELARLEFHIRTGNTGQISETVRAMVERAKLRNTNLFAARCLCFDIINTILRTMSDLDARITDRLREATDVFRLTHFETVDELADSAIDIALHLCDFIRDVRESGNFRLRDGVVAYIEQNYCRHTLSVQSIADEFGVSASYLSRYFRDQTGSRIVAFIENLRIERAKELLRSPDVQIKSVTADVGYSDVSSFIRRFRQLVGLTPGQYRNASVRDIQ